MLDSILCPTIGMQALTLVLALRYTALALALELVLVLVLALVYIFCFCLGLTFRQSHDPLSTALFKPLELSAQASVRAWPVGCRARPRGGGGEVDDGRRLVGHPQLPRLVQTLREKPN